MGSVAFVLDSSEGLARTLKVTLPWEKVDNAINARLVDMRAKVAMPGFRQGKVSDRLIQARFGAAVHEEVAKELAEKSAKEAIQEAQLELLTKPRVVLEPIKKGEPWSFSVFFEVQPEIHELAKPESFSYEALRIVISDEEIDAQLDRLRRGHATWHRVDRPIQEGDKVNLAFEGTVDGQTFDGSNVEQLTVCMGKNEIWPDLERQLLGLSAQAEDYFIETIVPNESSLKTEWLGKKAVFKLRVLDVFGLELPEWDEELVRTLGIASGDLAYLRQRIEEATRENLNVKVKDVHRKNVMDFLDQNHDFTLPKSIVEAELAQLKSVNQVWIKQLAETAVSDSEGNQALDDFMLELKKQAERRVKLGILVHRYAKAYGLGTSEEGLFEAVQKEVRYYKDPKKALAWIYKEPMRLAHFMTMILEDKLLDCFLSKGQAQHLDVTLDELKSKLY